jgi:pseudouridine kinase
MSAVKWCADAGTAAYLSLLTPNGDLAWAVSDYQIMGHFSPADLQARRPLLAGASFFVIDLNMSEAVLEATFALAHELGVAVAVDPTSSAKAASLRPYLAGLTLITPNADEAQILSGQPVHDSASALQAALHLHEAGVKQVVITLGVAGVVYMSAEGQGACLAPHTEILDTTGAGDALTAGLIFGLLEGQPLAQAIRCGLRAAQLTLACRASVNPALNAALLRDALGH